MGKSTQPAARITESIEACLSNSERLLDESYSLEFLKSTSTRLFILLIAQEEVAKAFILYLVREGIAPASGEVFRAMNDHTCKQLVGMILEYLVMRWETMEELEEEIRVDFELGELLPQDVGSALEIFAYEKIGRWKSNTWVWAKDPNYDRETLKVAKGAKDRHKQDSLYVRVATDGSVASTLNVIKDEETEAELERTRDYLRLVRSIVAWKKNFDGGRFRKIVRTLRVMFGADTGNLKVQT